MASTTTYYDQSSDYNWLDAILKNKSFCDPRTFEVHQCFVTTQVPRKSSSRPRTFNREVLVHTPPENRTRSVSEWVADSAPSWREEKPEQAPSINSTDNEDVASITSSTVCSSPDEDIPTFSQLEAFPPYP
ncbi:hypothetical protein N7532_011474 [Penicillium argentinense]|uniref:Uncharacterized protein n=1 Tax=Penicillium argentinense TaxID=1131581 RepID=A0A9W9EIG2_9EURO|nr:uncharacterized protein N7532_011474 [Penicillium argentinense]KAJ5082431.1 hypothetical protein N7532_011474 [Penicillium argentinense]